MEEELEILRACESYMQTNNIQALLKDVIAQLCLRQPRNPVSFLRQYFQKLERVSNFFCCCFIQAFRLAVVRRMIDELKFSQVRYVIAIYRFQ